MPTKHTRTVELGTGDSVTFELNIDLFDLDRKGRALVWQVLELVATFDEKAAARDGLGS
jgi:hypothetical protein